MAVVPPSAGRDSEFYCYIWVSILLYMCPHSAKAIAQQVETESARAAEVCCSLIETAKPMPSVV
jgi:hypothetical protein